MGPENIRAALWVFLISMLIFVFYGLAGQPPLRADMMLWGMIMAAWTFGRLRPAYRQEWRLELRQLYHGVIYFLVSTAAFYFLIRFATNMFLALAVGGLMGIYFASFYVVGRVLIYNKRYEEAHRFLDKLLAAFPQDSRLHTQKAAAYRGQMQYEQCILHATHAIEAHVGGREKSKTPSAVSTQTSEAFYLRSEAYSSLYDGAAALLDAELLLRADPNAPYAHFSHGLAMLSLNEFEEAVEDFEHILTMPLVPFQRAATENGLGLTAYCLRDYGASMHHYHKALDQSLTNAEKRTLYPAVYSNVACVHFVQRDTVTAWELAHTALEFDPQSNNARVTLAALHAFERSWQAALDIWQGLITDDERFADPDFGAEIYFRWTPPMAALIRQVVARANALESSPTR